MHITKRLFLMASLFFGIECADVRGSIGAESTPETTWKQDCVEGARNCAIGVVVGVCGCGLSKEAEEETLHPVYHWVAFCDACMGAVECVQGGKKLCRGTGKLIDEKLFGNESIKRE